MTLRTRERERDTEGDGDSTHSLDPILELLMRYVTIGRLFTSRVAVLEALDVVHCCVMQVWTKHDLAADITNKVRRNESRAVIRIIKIMYSRSLIFPDTIRETCP